MVIDERWKNDQRSLPKRAPGDKHIGSGSVCWNSRAAPWICTPNQCALQGRQPVCCFWQLGPTDMPQWPRDWYTQCDKKVLRLIFVWQNAWHDLQSTTGKKVVGCLTNEEKKQQCRCSHREVITVRVRNIYDDCYGNEYWTTKCDQVLLESRQNWYGNVRITTKGVRRRVCITCNHVPMVWQVLRRLWRRTWRWMSRVSVHQLGRWQHCRCARYAAVRSLGWRFAC